MSHSKIETAARLIVAESDFADVRAELYDRHPGITEVEAWDTFSRAWLSIRFVESGFTLGLDWPDIEAELCQIYPYLTPAEVEAAREYGLGLAIFRADGFVLAGRPSASTTLH